MTETKKKTPGIAQLTITLLLITAIVSLLLGLVNYITEDEIAEINIKKTEAAMSEVFPGDYKYGEIMGSDSLSITEGIVTGVFTARNAGDIEEGYVIRVEPSGFGGAVTMVVGIDFDGEITGVAIVNHAETSGLGANATREDFRDQYKGGSGQVALSKDGGDIDALTGATVTSKAVTDGVNAALEYVQNLG